MPFIKAASLVAIARSLFHIFTGYLGQMPYVQQWGYHLAFGVTV